MEVPDVLSRPYEVSRALNLRRSAAPEERVQQTVLRHLRSVIARGCRSRVYGHIQLGLLGLDEFVDNLSRIHPNGVAHIN